VKKLLLVLIFALSFVPLTASADSLNGKYVACITEALFNEIQQAAANRDKTQWIYLRKHGCIMPKAGLKASVMSRTWTGTVKVRVYLKDTSVVLWTYDEALSSYHK